MAGTRNLAKYQQLIGTNVNGWDILDIFINEKDNCTYARVKCRCGAIKEYKLTLITHGRIIDCGCGHKERMQQIIKDKYAYLIGTKINSWTVLDIIPPEDSGGFTYALCQCECGTVRKVRLTYLINGRSKNCGCGRSRYHAKNNEHIMQFLSDINIKYIPEYTVVIDEVKYRYDFYLPDYNLSIEYDGEQHFKPVNFGGMSDEDAEKAFVKCQEHDQIKNKYCEDNNIHLLRIPYWEKKNIDTIIGDCLQRLIGEGSTAIT